LRNNLVKLRVAAILGIVASSQASGGITEPSEADKSIEYLRYIFGDVVNVITGGGSPDQIDSVLGAMSQVMAAGMLIFTGIIVCYVLITGLLDSANEGNPMGKAVNQMWVPLRMVLAMGLVLPLGGGYSAMQVAVLWVAGQGVGLADSVWTGSLSYLRATSSLVAPPLRDDHDRIADSILNSRVCMRATNDITRHINIVEQPRSIIHESPVMGEAEDANAFIPAVLKSSGYAQHSQIYGSKYSPLSAAAAYTAARLTGFSNGMPGHYGAAPCGALHVKFPAVDVGTGAASISRDFQDSIVSAISELDFELDSLAEQITLAVRDSDSYSQPDIDFYRTLTGTFRQRYHQAVSQALRDLGELRIGRWSDGNPSNAMTTIGAKDAGWITAGAWYWDILRLNREGLALVTVDVEYAPPQGAVLTLEGMPLFTAALRNYHNIKLVTDDQGKPATGLERSEYAREVGGAGWILDALEGILSRSVDSPDPIGVLAAGSMTIGSTLISSIATSHVVATVACSLEKVSSAIPVVGGIINAGAAPTCYTSEWARNLGLGLAAILLPILAFLGIYLPAIPLIMWIMGIAGWFLLLIEAVVAAPIWAASHAMPEGNGFVGQRAMAGYMVLLSLFLRPTLMLFGLFASMILGFVLFKVLGFLFVPWLSTRFGDEVSAMIWMIGGLGLFSIVMIQIAHRTFGLIHEIPDKVLRYIGGGNENLGEAGSEKEGRAFFVGSVAKVSAGANAAKAVAKHPLAKATPSVKATAGGLSDGGQQSVERTNQHLSTNNW
tara:strand:- start:4993 stop:7323 length:2331 start_codon:yes stop_codon:yes gene_type:complete